MEEYNTDSLVDLNDPDVEVIDLSENKFQENISDNNLSVNNFISTIDANKGLEDPGIDCKKLICLQAFEINSSSILSINVVPNTSLIIFGSCDDTAIILDADNGEVCI